MSPGLTIDDLARFLSHATWLERRLFEVLGRWVTTTPEPGIKLALGRHSRHHAWHAQLLEPLRPDTRDHHVEQRAPLDKEWRTRVSRMLAAATTSTRLERALDVLVGTIACYEQHLAAMRPVRDGPARRAVGLVRALERAELAELEALRRIDAGTGSIGR
ncbi:MAG: hypothetical protein WEA75_01660 [Acidimicrobiia bacterium]